MLSRNRMQNITFVVAEDFNFDYEENKTVGDFINLMFNFAMVSTILKEETCAILPKFILGKYCKIGYSRKLIPVTTYITIMQCFQQKHQRWRHCVKRKFHPISQNKGSENALEMTCPLKMPLSGD